MKLLLWFSAALCLAGDFTIAEQEQFLLKASMVTSKKIGIGVTDSVRATVTDGKLTHDAHLQAVDVYMMNYQAFQKSEVDFRDCWRYNVAAYRVAKLLGVADMVPVSVERRNLGSGSASLTWWVDDVLMDEAKRRETKAAPPDLGAWREQMSVMNIFDQLIYNTDRNLGNLLITRDWRIKLIDHTRAFRAHRILRDSGALTTCRPELLQALIALDFDTLHREIGTYVDSTRIKGMLARRDLIVKHFAPAAHAKLKRS